MASQNVLGTTTEFAAKLSFFAEKKHTNAPRKTKLAQKKCNFGIFPMK